MIVHNITVKTDWAIFDGWLNWQLHEHIPQIMATGLFDHYKIYRLLDQDDDEGPTIVIQLSAQSEEKYRQYIDEFADRFIQHELNKWGDRFVAYRTAMHPVH